MILEVKTLFIMSLGLVGLDKICNKYYKWRLSKLLK